MKAVISQTWLIGESHVDDYLAISAALDDWLRAQPGAVGRTLIRSDDDPTHIIHVRTYESLEAYTDLMAAPEYQRHIDDLSAHVDPSRYPPGAAGRTYGDVLLSWDEPPG